MHYTFNKRTLIAQWRNELERAFTESPKMSDAELTSISDKLYEAWRAARTVRMAQIIRSVRYIYTDEQTRRDNLERARLAVAIMFHTDDLLYGE